MNDPRTEKLQVHETRFFPGPLALSRETVSVWLGKTLALQRHCWSYACTPGTISTVQIATVSSCNVVQSRTYNWLHLLWKEGADSASDSPLQEMACRPSGLQCFWELLFHCLSFLPYQWWLPGKPSTLLRFLLHPLTHHQSPLLYPLYPDLSHPQAECLCFSRCFVQSHSSCLPNYLLGSAGFVFGVSSWWPWYCYCCCYFQSLTLCRSSLSRRRMGSGG